MAADLEDNMFNPKETLDKMVEAITARKLNYYDLVLYHDGEWHTRVLQSVANCQNCYSVTKAYTAAAIGIANDMGLLKLDDTLHTFFDGDKRVTVKHLLTHTMGNEHGYLFEADRHSIQTDNWLAHVLAQPLKHEPGTHVTYSNSNFYLISRIIHKVSGMNMSAFLRKHLFTPLGIKDFAWAECPQDYTQGGTGLHMSTKDMAKLGVLYLNKGVWGGKQIISEAWINEATKNQTSHIPWTRFGFGLNALENGFEFAGAYNQFVTVDTQNGVVVAAHGYIDPKSITSIYELEIK